MIEAKDVAGDVVEPTTARQMPLDVGLQPLDDLARQSRVGDEVVDDTLRLVGDECLQAGEGTQARVGGDGAE